MNKYQKGKIYKLIDRENNNQYIGSTIRSLNERLDNHRYKYRLFLKNKHHYVSSFDILKGGNYKIKLIENYPCNNKKELLRREGYYIRQLECVNRDIAGRTRKEYINDNREKIRLYDKKKRQSPSYKEKKRKWDRKYREKNKDKLREKKKKYRENNKDKIREKSKKYYEQNKERIRQWGIQYRTLKNESIKKRKNKKYECECGGRYTHSNKQQHYRSKKHKNFVDGFH